MLARLTLALSLIATPCAFAQTWEAQSPDGGWIQSVVGNASGGSHAYAVAFNALFLSDDAGRTWRLPAQRIGGKPNALSLQASNPARVVMVDAGRRFLRSDDYGDTWTASGHVVERDVDVLAAPAGAVVYVAGVNVRRSVNAGATFAPVQGLPADVPVITLAVNPFLDTEVVAGMAFSSNGSARLYRSNDSGATWSPLFAPAISGQANSVVFLSATGYAASIGGRIYTTSDNGANWSPVYDLANARLVRLPQSNELVATNGIACTRTSTLFATTQDCMAGLPAPPSGVAVPISSLTVVRDGATDRLLATVRGGGIFALDSSASAWTASNRQLSARAVQGLALSPRDPVWMAAGNAAADLIDAPLRATRDGAASWQPALDQRLTSVSAVEFDPTTGPDPATTRLYAAGGGARAAAGQGASGVFRSDDGGSNWIALDTGVPTGAILTPTSLALDPRACATPPATGQCNSGPLYRIFALTRASDAYRIVRSTQSGQNWIAVGEDLPAYRDNEIAQIDHPTDIAFDAGGNAIYVSTYAEYFRIDGAPLTPFLPNGVFRSTDDGTNWTNASSGLPTMDGALTAHDVYAIAAHPRRSGVLYASTIRNGQDARIYKSLDGGGSWAAAGATLADCDVRDLDIDKAAPDVVIAAGVSRSRVAGCLWRSENGGNTWTPLHANLPASQVSRVRQSPHDRRRLVVATDTGIWAALAPSDRVFDDGFDGE